MKKNKLQDLSPYLFWDVDRKKINPVKNKKWIIQRVLEYGLLNDWLLIREYYGIKEIAEISTEIKDMDNKSASFVSLLSNIPLKNFLCYTTKALSPKHWNF